MSHETALEDRVGIEGELTDIEEGDNVVVYDSRRRYKPRVLSRAESFLDKAYLLNILIHH